MTGQDLLGPLPPATRGRDPARPRSKGERAQSLPAATQSRKLDVYSHSPASQISEDSLCWDPSNLSVFTSDDNRGSVTTNSSAPYTGKEPSKFAYPSSSSDEFEDPAEEEEVLLGDVNLDFLNEDDVEPEKEKSSTVSGVVPIENCSEQSIKQPQSMNHTLQQSMNHTVVENQSERNRTMTDQVRKHRSDLNRVRMVYEDDLEDVDPSEVTSDYLKDRLKTAEEMKTLAQNCILYLSENDDSFTNEQNQEARGLKRSILTFIKNGQKALKEAEDTLGNRRGEFVSQVDPVRAASCRIRQDRVKSSEAKVVDDLNNVVQELIVIQLTKPSSDSELRTLAERFSTVNKKAERLMKEARQLYNDAVETGLEAPAKSIGTAVQELLDTQLETESAVQEQKSLFGLLGVSDTTKLSDIELPTFSGEPGDKLDYYSFEDEFSQYLKTKSYSKSDQLRVLQRSALQGTARAACLDFTEAAEVWKYLKDTYGNVRILIANKIVDLKKLGPCQGTDLKKREWCLNIRAKLKYIHNLALKHDISDELYFSPVIVGIQAALPQKLQDDFKAKFRDEDKIADMSRKSIFLEFLSYLEELITNFTSDINYDMTSLNLNKFEAAEPKPVHGTKPPQKPFPTKKTFSNMKKPGKQQPAPGGAKMKRPVMTQGCTTEPQSRECVICHGSHTHLQYCEKFQKGRGRERYQMAGKVKACFRCLRMDAEVDFNNREAWFESHKPYCDGSWECKQGRCGSRPPVRQYHFLLCNWHSDRNQSLESEFKKSLNQSLLKPGSRFFYNSPCVYNVDPIEIPVEKIDDGYIVLPDIDEPSIFLLQTVRVDGDKILLLFYDSGCMGASISSRAVSLMDTVSVRPGPTFMSVAGAETIRLETGDERFWLVLADGSTKATLTGLHMPNITTPFPTWDLQEAWDEIQSSYVADSPKGEPLPLVPTSVGGVAVDIMLGIRYHIYFPTLMYTLPSGLGIYKSKFASGCGKLGILGGPHKAWRKAREAAHMLGPRAYLTNEARAYFMESFLLRKTMGSPCSDEPEVEFYDNPGEDPELNETCLFKHCSKHENETGWMIPVSWSLNGSKYIIRDDSPKFSEIDALGTETEYRCMRCRNCNDCRKGDILERVSLQEESEQALIENCVSLNASERRLEARLPFVHDPLVNLTPNRNIAEKILESQMRLVSRNPEMLEDTVKSHDKLRLKGHVIPYTELTEDERNRMDATPGAGYIIPWRTVYKQSSLSTPCRMVFDASSRTPAGDSLNNVLAKGQNKLTRILNILTRFRTKPSAMTADVSMAYNGVKLAPEHYKFQRYLWRENLSPSNPVIIMIVRTLIYGVRPSGNLTMAGFDKLANHCLENYPEHARGALVLSQDAYMDDVLHAEETPEECRLAAESLDFTLALGSMTVKAYTFSGSEPSELVSPDGKHVGLVGLLWDSANDLISLDIKDLYLGKPRRGKLPEIVTGDVGMALKEKFTRRIVTGKAHGVFDPLGLATPVTARFKLNLHDLCRLQLDWDDRIPDEYLESWVKNLNDIQRLKEIKFRRSVIPPDAANLNVELITSVDASEKIGVATVHSRILLKSGDYYVQLVCAKSKLVSTSTVPRAELKAAVMGAVLNHVTKVNFGNQYTGSIFVSDSTVALYWINQDQRPLQTAVRNSVIEVRRFSQTDQWFHIETNLNIADLGTRRAEVEDIGPDSEWQQGKGWMKLKRDEMPLRTIEEITMTSEERRTASLETKAPDILGIVLSNLTTKVGDRYSFSKYLVDPCVMSWPKSVRILAYVFRFLLRVAPRHQNYRRRILNSPVPVTEVTNASGSELRNFQLSAEEIDLAERYYFLKATGEVKQFSKEKDWKSVSVEKDGILLYSGRILDGQEIVTVENSMFDLEPLSFVKPIVDRYSPIAYSIMGYCHASIVKHRNAVTTLRESRSLAYILQGRDLSNEIRESCVSCRRFKAKLLEVEMGKVHENRLTIAPAFYQVQVDLLGPYIAACEHNHRSTVQVYGVVFKDPATAAIAVHTMQNYTTDAFLQAYTRFSSRFGHPNKLFIDEGSQLMKACRKMEINITDLTQTLNSQYQVGIEYQTCPVGGHNAHGVVERSIREVKKLFNLLYSGLKLDIMSYETAFSSISNELNNLPICLGSRTSNLEHVDLITPSRLILGRNNRRGMGGFARISGPSRLMEQMEKVYRAWWQVWKDERLLDYIPQPRQWLNTRGEIKVGDIVIFLKSDADQVIGDPVWKMGKIKELELSNDGLARTAIIEYKNSSETVFRTTRRSVRKIAVLHREGELELVQELNEAARKSRVLYLSAKHNK